jgi:hypothetical protein
MEYIHIVNVNIAIEFIISFNGLGDVQAPRITISKNSCQCLNDKIRFIFIAVSGGYFLKAYT